MSRARCRRTSWRTCIANTELSYEDILADDPELRHQFCATCFKTFGIYDDAAEQMATEAETYADEQGSTIEDAIVETLCSRVAYIAGVVLLNMYFGGKFAVFGWIAGNFFVG